jgi:hypothetical protein
VTVARPDIDTGLPERELSQPYVLQTASGETIAVVKETRVELTTGRHSLRIWCSSLISRTSFWGWISCGLRTRQWTQDSACYDWAEMRCQ